MKKFAVFVVTASLLLAGCTTQVPVPVETPPVEIPDIDTIIQQSVDKAMAQYEEEQRVKDAEIEELKAQLEALTAQKEEASAEPVPEDTGIRTRWRDFGRGCSGFPGGYSRGAGIPSAIEGCTPEKQSFLLRFRAGL